jgi:prepilin peptidase CpaA
MLPVFPVMASVALLLLASLRDLSARTVPNWLSATLGVAGVLARAMDDDLAAGLLAATAVFVVAAICWRRGWLGGGDVKLLGAAATAVPPGSVLTLIVVMALAGGGLSLFYLAARRLVPAPAAQRPGSLMARVLRVECWRIRRGGPLPYACAIAAGGLFVLL